MGRKREGLPMQVGRGEEFQGEEETKEWDRKEACQAQGMGEGKRNSRSKETEGQQDEVMEG